MGTGWRKAFCTTISRDSESNNVSEKQRSSGTPNPSPRSCVRLGFFSNPSTPRLQSHQPLSSPGLRCRTAQDATVNQSPTLHCKTSSSSSSTPKSAKSQRGVLGSNPSSPRSPLKLSLFKNSFKFRSSCGICLSSVKTGHGTAIYTAECSHAFHFPCIAAHVRNHATLVCPVCNTTWKDVPLLAAHKNLGPLTQHDIKPKIEDKTMIESSPRAFKSKQDPKEKPSEFRSYDDDEPLLSPTSGGRIIPIPEADENQDDVEEFQGFFVHPKPPSSAAKSSIQRTNVQVRLLPETALISSGHAHETYAVALKVKAPPPHPARNRANANLLDPSRRAPIDLVTVLDVSGSMTGPKLMMLKRAMRLVISSLGSSDRLAIVAFSATPKRVLPLRRMTAQGQRAARQVIDTLVCSQGTSVGEALRKATKVLEDRRERNPVASIMLLSDGQDERTHSNQRQMTRHESSTRFAHIEIPVHAFGFGKSGGYCQEPAEDAFAKCVSGLLSVVVQDLRIQLGFPTGSSPVVISAIYSCTGRPTVCSLGSVRLGDLYAEEERELLVELKIPTSAAGTHHVMTMQCLYKDPSTQEVVYSREQDILIARPVAVGSSAPKIERLRNMFITTRAVAESRRLIEYDDHTSAHHLLASARALLIQSGSSSADVYVRELEVELAELHWRRQQQFEIHQQQQHQQHLVTTTPRRRGGGDKENPTLVDENGEPLTPTSAWRAAEKLARVAIMKKSLTSRVGDLHGFENARF
ncbi:E3 ubiquitin-protein ligase WAV3 [Benincasa hispida]|uniref:E3 ubiquitin-protein ligase WAV3 n=1 Tax=Benincasa hispida TaxID=102211 RepID=UPI001900F76F|nr:E3 ubiquitin-protein ligase WAV3 [Benincasa hispida]